jgi:hypothetical protein
VNIWQRFQMPAHGRKGQQQILPWRPTYGAPASSCDIVRRSVSSTEVSVSAGGTRSLFFARHAGRAASLILVAIAPGRPDGNAFLAIKLKQRLCERFRQRLL